MAPVTITYTSHPAPSQPINQAIRALRDQLPLRNLHWKPTTRTSLRTIQELDVELVELGDVPTGGRSGLGSVLEQPLVNLCMVVCEDSETYKNSTKSFIRDWLSLLSSRRGAIAPLIVLVNPPTALASSGKNVFGRDKGVLGKLKSDFNTGKRDRCVQINLPAEGRDDPAAWPEVVNKIKESVVLALDAAIVEREEEVKRGEAQRMMVGWNFCTWFLLKESLAHSFEAVGLPSDALVIYEELEATFFQILKEQNLSWFGKLGATSPNDDSLPVLDTRSKPYREMLQGSAISIFDFRVYVFARQAKLLGQLGRITEVAKRGQWFVASLTRRLRESEEDLAEHFIESWTYTACMDIVQKCDEWSRIDRPNGDYSGLVAYESARSELLDIARVQVERIGVAVGHLPNAYPFAASSALLTAADDVLFESSETGSLPDEGEAETHPRQQMSNRQLVEAKNDETVFRELYTSLTKKAILAYEACAKMNSIIRLRTDLAALALHVKAWQHAYELCRASVQECVSHSLTVWAPVAKFSLEGAIRSHRELGMTKEAEWKMLALAYLRVCSKGARDQQADELEWVMTGLRDCECVAESILDHDVFKVRFLDEVAQHDEKPDYSVVTVEITNNLPVSYTVSSIRVCWQGSTTEDIWFEGKTCTLQPGPNVIELTCRMLAHGIYDLGGTEIEIGKMGGSETETGKIAFAYSPSASGTQLLMRRPPGAVQAKLTMPRRNALDGDTEVVVRLNTQACNMKNVRLQLESKEDAMQYDLSAAKIEEQPIESQEDAILLGDLEARSIREVVIPYFGTPHGDVSSASITITYTAEDGIESSWTETQDVRIALPMTVNVQDFFRPDCLVSQFTMAADSDESLRVASVELQPPASGYAVDAGSRKATNSVTLTPSQSLTRVFRIRRTGTPEGPGPAVLRLVIHYLTVNEELEAGIESVLDSTTSSNLRREVYRRMKDQKSWMNGYLSRGWSAVFEPSWTEGVVIRGQITAEEIDSLLERLTTQPTPDVMRTLEIPVDVPSRRVLTTVMMQPQSPTKGPIYEGRAIPVRVQMRTTLAWAGEVNTEQLGKMIYDIVPIIEDWLVIGVKRGFYLLDGTDTVVEREIVLVPMRSGHLFLPIVTVNLANSGGEDGLISETYLENAAEALEILPAKSGGVAMIPLESSWEVEAERRV